MRVHLFPSRTQKLSSFAPTILGGRLPGKIGNANIKPTASAVGSFLPASVHWTLATARQYLAYPGRWVTSTYRVRRKSGSFFTPGTVHGTVTDGATIILMKISERINSWYGGENQMGSLPQGARKGCISLWKINSKKVEKLLIWCLTNS